MKFHNPDAETFPWVMGVKFIQTKKGLLGKNDTGLLGYP